MKFLIKLIKFTKRNNLLLNYMDTDCNIRYLIIKQL